MGDIEQTAGGMPLWQRRAMQNGATPGSYSGGGSGSGGGPSYTGPISPVDVANPNPNALNGYEGFRDNAYNEATRRLDPQFADQERAFRQRMVNQGLQEGTQAYNTAWDNFSRSKNDAYDQARSSAWGQGLAAQNQFWGQNAHESDLANELQRAQWNYDAQLSGNDVQRYGIDAGIQNNQANNALQRELGLGNLGLARDQFDAQNGQNDFQNMMALMGFDFGGQQYNNELLNQDSARANPMMGLIPGVNPSQVDVMGAYGLNQNAQNSAYQGQLAQNNGQMGATASLASSAIMAAVMM